MQTNDKAQAESTYLPSQLVWRNDEIASSTLMFGRFDQGQAVRDRDNMLDWLQCARRPLREPCRPLNFGFKGLCNIFAT